MTMKFLLLAFLLTFAAADFQRATKPVVRRAVHDYAHGLHKAGSLRRAVRLPGAVELDIIERDVKDELIENLKGVLDDLIKKITERIEEKKQVGKDLLDKIKEVSDKLQELGVGVKAILEKHLDNFKEKVKGLWDKLIDQLGIGKRRAVSRGAIKNIIEDIKERILKDENIQKIREYIENFVTRHPVLLKLKEILLKLKNIDLKELLRHLLDSWKNHGTRNARGIKELWDKVKDFFNKLGIHISEHYSKFALWVVEIYGKGLEQLKEKHGIIKAIAMEFIEHAKDIHAELAREALEFFQPYKEELGDLWTQIVEITKKIIQ